MGKNNKFAKPPQKQDKNNKNKPIKSVNSSTRKPV